MENVPHLESLARNVALDMAVLHVIDVAQNLELVVHGGGNGVQTVGDQSDLLVEFGITGQGIKGDSGELGEVFLDTGSLLEEPFRKTIIKLFFNQLFLKILFLNVLT